MLGINYSENDGDFASKIKKTSVFKQYLSSVKSSNKSSASSVKEFRKSDDADLFYALHNATVSLKKSGTKYNSTIYDIFDFALDNNYNDLFTSIVNNWAWLCQNTSILYKISINVTFIA